VTALRAAVIAAAAFLIAAIALLVILLQPRPSGQADAPPPGAATADAAVPARTIKARLFYVSDDGTRLTSVEREVPFAEGGEQAREIIAAQIAPAPATLVSAVPPGTSLRALYVTDRGDAYVDLSGEVVTAHTGGTLNELLTVYTIVNAVTVNVPAIRSVQILVGGKEVPTLAGHVDLRQPLAKNAALVQ
jgi:hypothetical protein